MVLNIIKVFYRWAYKVAVVVKPIITAIIPPKTRQRVKRLLLKKAFPIDKNHLGKAYEQGIKGINLLGYARAEMGIGESCRIAANNLQAAGIPFGILNFTGTNSARMQDLTWANKEMDEPIYNINLLHINAEQMTEIYAHYGNNLFQNRYSIGYWHWELPDFPDEWLESFSLVDEVWAPSTFVADAIAAKSPVPVVKIPHSIEVEISEPRDRAYFHLPEQTFLFLAMYDVKSYQERKNPLAAIKAFKAAFKPDDSHVGLVLKVNSSKSDTAELNALHSLIQDYPNIYLIKETISRNDVNSLLNVTDCFVSLHRSEGFGLGLAEAMYLGKPVIGTNWSSNIDFMNHNNSCLVNCKLINVGKDYGPYKAFQQWADPDIQEASSYMKKLVLDKVFYRKIAESGQAQIREKYSPEAVGKLIRQRIEYIELWKFGGQR